MTALSTPGSTPMSQLIGDSVVRAPVGATIRDVSRVLTEGAMGVVVLGDEARPVAVVSERDVVRAVASGSDVATTPALEVATTDLVWCDVEATVDEVANEMMDRYIRHVLVEEDGALVGIVSARDLLGSYSVEAAID